ncbi:MAG: hypothetical protein CVV64_17815 [Candidatus Wallbacteria bacterium HGW-Wallbacteria-1]|jgi:lipid-binding SYLF domain-containing protein|uniref:Ysc84 actin-binding domain-containing protein n=1 Tax=Candidatus Wallbacteria bacterium HGW-Wallbacteria-1 TaxID=2013854 RepID=A0A2N1PJY1_9BACT|nr:MAG: hypothetical protein CVV64_17815 [Candidatus Wallbacteria bacterium HGW-Wallbacteria-1]
MKKILSLLVLTALICGITPSPSSGWRIFNRKHTRSGEENAQLFIEKVKKIDSYMANIFKSAVGWAVFPEIGKAGVGIGAAAGNGKVYSRTRGFIGTSTLFQASIGFQLGGQVYSEIIFFQDEPTLERFMDGKLELGASVSAVLIDEGAAREAGFRDGTMVFVLPRKGLMYEATLNGQKFTFKGTEDNSRSRLKKDTATEK